jgi:hypothetical protein
VIKFGHVARHTEVPFIQHDTEVDPLGNVASCRSAASKVQVDSLGMCRYKRLGMTRQAVDPRLVVVSMAAGAVRLREKLGAT